MPVFSANSIGGASISEATANTDYVGMTGAARCMYESYLNEATLFEAMLNNDFHEIHGLREGTILESELKSLNEASVKGVYDTLRNMLTKAWEKIKGAFQALYRNIVGFLASKTKGWATKHEKDLLALKPETLKKISVTGYAKYAGIDKIFNDKSIYDATEKAIKAEAKAASGTKDINKQRIAALQLTVKGELSGKIKSADKYRAIVKAAAFEKEAGKKATAADVDIKNALNTLKTGGSKLAELRNCEKRANSHFKNAIRELNTAEKASTDEKASTEIKAQTDSVKVFQTAMNAMCGAQMDIVKTAIAQDFAILRRIANFKPQKEAALYEEDEAMADAAEDEDIEVVNDFLTDDSPAELPEEVPEELVDVDDDGVDVKITGDADEPEEVDSDDGAIELADECKC